MGINKEQWVKIEGDLKDYFASVDFQYKGIEIGVRRVSIGEGRTALAVFLDGEMRSGWGWPNSDVFNPLVECFWSKRQKSYYSPTKVKKLEKIYGKRRVKKEISNLHEKFTWYHPYFSKASVLVRQFKRIKELTLKVDNEGDLLWLI
ncbi:hypothetical protein KOL64_17675 [Providencia rettgeri]|uniref:Uncharacterized protein n=2 Tax=Morganellaceae TaxID=1903414 RepID=A0AAJ4TI73_PRORE|nr:hypothetical protein [Providencia rettgeri]QWQ16563.2 hypothetical protein KOL65_17670 [Providencia rettgeri]QWQ20398.2 hypothetical protein KOF27_17690 [Providencia rettgeri]QWQ24233.2 hypothetical protein KOL64_17675 [Providencia rettgeri]